MKFRIERDAFADAVTWVGRTLPSKSTHPILTGILIDATSDGITLFTFDTETAAQMELPADVSETGRVLVPGRLLGDIARSLPPLPVEFTVDGSRIQVTCGRSAFTLPTLSVSDYPVLPEMPTTVGTVPGATFAAAVAQVAIAAGRLDSHAALTGILIEVNGTTVTLAATDRFRLAVREFDWMPAVPGAELTALAPAKGLADTAKSLASADTVGLGANATENASLLGFEGNNRRTTSRLLNEAYPKYRDLFPKEAATSAVMDTATLIESVKRVSLVAERNTPVKMSFTDGEVVLSAGNGDEAQAKEVLECTLEGPDISIALNPHYLLDGLGVLDAPKARMSFTVPEKPVVLRPATDSGDSSEARFHYLLMPVRLG